MHHPRRGFHGSSGQDLLVIQSSEEHDDERLDMMTLSAHRPNAHQSCGKCTHDVISLYRQWQCPNILVPSNSWYHFIQHGHTKYKRKEIRASLVTDTNAKHSQSPGYTVTASSRDCNSLWLLVRSNLWEAHSKQSVFHFRLNILSLVP